MRDDIRKLVEEQIAALADEDWYNRSAAAEVLGSLGHEAAPAVDALIAALADEEGAVDWDAAKALVRVGEAAVPKLESVPPDTRAGWFARKVLHRIAPERFAAPEGDVPPGPAKS